MERPIRFDPNSDEHLEWALKLAYKYTVGDMTAASEETASALCDALCNLIGHEAFCEFSKNEVNAQ